MDRESDSLRSRRDFLKLGKAVVNGAAAVKAAEIALNPDKSYTEFTDYFQDFEDRDNDSVHLRNTEPNDVVTEMDIVYVLTEEPLQKLVVDKRGFEAPYEAELVDRPASEASYHLGPEIEEVEGYLNSTVLDFSTYRIEAYMEDGGKYEETVTLEEPEIWS